MAPVSLVISLIRSTSVVHEWTYKVVGQANVAYRDSHTFVRRGMRPSRLRDYSKACSYCSVNF